MKPITTALLLSILATPAYSAQISLDKAYYWQVQALDNRTWCEGNVSVCTNVPSNAFYKIINHTTDIRQDRVWVGNQLVVNINDYTITAAPPVVIAGAQTPTLKSQVTSESAKTITFTVECK